MLGDSVTIREETLPVKMPDKSITDLSSPPPAKKLKQARLSFKILEPKPVADSQPSPTSHLNNGGKKRRHPSDSPKATKLQKSEDGSKVKQRPQSRQDDAENEVSSSSEAEFVAKVSSPEQKVGGKPRGLERFVQSTQQTEVSTSCTEVIDLTADDNAPSSRSTEGKLSPVVCKESVKKSELPKDGQSKEEAKIQEGSPEKKDVVPIQEVKPSDTNTEVGTIEDKKSHQSSDDDNSKEYMSSVHEEEKSNEAKECDNSVLNSTMESLNESLSGNDKSVLSEKGSLTPSTPSTPNTRVLKRPPLSSSKTKQKEEDRQRKREEREKLRAEKEKQKELEKNKKEEVKKEKERLREEQRKEKERLKQEEKEKKEQERLQREREKQEKQAEKEKEREEKQRQKDEERRKKQEAQEAKLEEKKKKEEEREAEKRRKEEEKQKEEAQKNRKIQQSQNMFQKFFTKVEPAEPPKTTDKVGPFPAFHVLPNMRMAPSNRRPMSESRRQDFDEHLDKQSASDLYVSQLKAGNLKPGSSGRTWPIEDDVVVQEANVEQPPAMKHKKKLLKFHENYRPAYFGTWRKKSHKIGPRNPFAKDEDFLDYEVDSDDEWEEEEPGESLSNSEGEGEEGDEDKDDDEDNDGFFVPHGYLSEGEGGEDSEEEDGNPEKMKMRQIIKAKAFEAELMKRTELLQKMVVGVLWSQADSKPDPCLSQYSATLLTDEAPIMIQEATESSMKEVKKKRASMKQAKIAKERGQKPLHVPEEAMPDLIKLVHGNMCSLKKLIREFRVFWSRSHQPLNQQTPTFGNERSEASMEISDDSAEKNSNSSEDHMLKTSQIEDTENKTGGALDKSEEDEQDGINSKDPNMISRRQLDIKLKSIAVYEKRKEYHKKCWYVSEEVLKRYELSDLPVPTKWEWLTQVPAKAKPKDLPENGATPSAKKPGKDKDIVGHSTPNNHSIKQFAVPGLVHTYEVSELPKLSSSPNVTQGSAKKPAKRITPITLFCAKKTDVDGVLQPISSTNVTQGLGVNKPPIVHAQNPLVEGNSTVDDDCMIIDEPFVPPPPSKSQPTLVSMLAAKNNA